MSEQSPSQIIDISPLKFLAACALASIGILIFGKFHPIPAWVVAAEVFFTVISLFVFGSIRVRLDKNALTYGMVMVITATFWESWWIQSGLRQNVAAEGTSAVGHFLGHYFLTLHGWDALVHADTMLFILGLTFFVAVVAQTRLLETVSFAVLKKNKGAIVPTVAILTALVSAASGVLDGVSMIGLMIRTLVIILFLARVKDGAVIYAVMVSTVVTTVCGMWLAYGEPPNLIMKANLHPHLNNAFFLRYCLPVAVGSYFIVLWNVRRKLAGQKVEMQSLDVLDLHTADVRFLQASRHGEVLTPIEFVENHKDLVGDRLEPVLKRLHHGEPLGEALVRENVPAPARLTLLGKYVSEEMSSALDEHYQAASRSENHNKDKAVEFIRGTLDSVRVQRVRAQWIGGISFLPFIGLLIYHAINHEFPLFWASFAGFAVAGSGIYFIPRMRKLAFSEAAHEYKEYLFLLPLFFSITLLQKTGFFNQLSGWLHIGIEKLGYAHMAYLQFTGATFLSAILDNNVVADFTSRALHGLDLGVLHLFSMAQIAGYAAGGCWTHIGCAQSVVAYAFIQKEINEHYTPFQWIKEMTPVIVEIFILMTFVVYGEGMLLRYFH
jgi:hypothetical protein